MNDPFTEPNPTPHTAVANQPKKKCCPWKPIAIVSIIIALVCTGGAVFFFIQSQNNTPETGSTDANNSQSTGTPEEHTLAGQLEAAYCKYMLCSDDHPAPDFSKAGEEGFQPQASSAKPRQFLIYPITEDLEIADNVTTNYYFFNDSPSAEWAFFTASSFIQECSAFLFPPIALSFGSLPCHYTTLITDELIETTVQDFFYTVIDPRN